MRRTPEGSLIAEDGRTLFYSWQQFVSEICEGDNCFICGRSPQATAFDREHILPNWLLRQFDLHGKRVSLPNEEQHRYGTYLLPCCVDCNRQLGAEFEVPIGAAVAEGFAGVEAMVRREGPMRLFIWMALIFLKLHLKDGRLRLHLDHRRGDERIGDAYAWETFHHLHSLVRSAHTDASVDHRVMGSFLIMAMADDGQPEVPFDLASVTVAQSLYLRMGDVALFAVFDDATASLTGLEELIARIDGPLERLQARELLAELAACNLHLENRPRFATRVSVDPEQVHIEAFTDPRQGPKFLEKDHELVGHLKWNLLRPWVGQIVVPEGADDPEALLKSNQLSLLFDNQGRLIRDGWHPAG